jgi:hypothetical protein
MGKIEKLKLKDIIVAMFDAGKKENEIAEALNVQLAERGIEDTISQPTVNRFLRPYRTMEREKGTQIIHDHVVAKITNTLERIDKIEDFHFDQALGKREEGKPELDLKLKSDFLMRAAKIAELKLRYALVNPDSGNSTSHPVNLDDYVTEAEKDG